MKSCSTVLARPLQRGGAKGIQSVPFIVRIRLDDEEVAKRLPAGATGTAAIYNRSGQADPYHSKGPAAPDCHPQLCQSILSQDRRA